MKLEKPLINEKYTKKDLPILLEQYKLICDGADKITERRQNSNKFYLGVNSFLFVVAGYVVSLKSNLIPVLISFVGLMVSFCWWRNINSFKQLNAAKFKVIHALEEYLPARIYKKEDEYLSKGYYKLTTVEKKIPFIFCLLYFVIIFFILVNLILSLI